MSVQAQLRAGFPVIWGAVRKNVEAMPESGMDFRPEGLEMRSFREIALHMANACAVFGENVGKLVWERMTLYPPDRLTAKAQVLDALDKAGEQFLAGVARLSDEEAARIVRAPWGSEMPQAAVVGGNIPHMFYHNGQLSIYLRLRGIRPLFVSI